MIRYDKEHIDYMNNTERTIIYSAENNKAISITYTFSVPQDMQEILNAGKPNRKPAANISKSKGKVFKV